METLLSFITNLCNTAIKENFPNENITAVITPAVKEHFGHYQCNSAMKLGKLVSKNPLDVAEILVASIPKDSFSSVTIVKPGFINFTFTPFFIIKQINNLLENFSFSSKDRKKIIVEFSSPNIAKEMHVGHLRSTLIGNCLANVFSLLGHEVLRLNHLGDWGTSFGMLIAYLNSLPENEKKSMLNIEHLTLLYKKAKQKFDEDDQFKTISRETVVQLQNGNPLILKDWETICNVSREYFQVIYDLLDITICERGESFYNPFLPKIIRDLEEKKLITLSEGAKCVFIEKAPIPLMLQKSDGGFNYDTTDTAAMYHRVYEEKADVIIIVTDLGQSLHFKLIDEVCKKAQYLNSNTIFHHVTFGLVLGNDGKKFKTRSGETVKLIDLLNTAITKAKDLLIERNYSDKEEELSRAALILGINAVKYSDLSCSRDSDYVFSFEKMLKFEGNTACFILYSYVRIKGIKRFVKIDEETLAHKKIEHLEHPTEILLALHLARFSETLIKASENFYPHYITDYLYELANKFNSFFRDCRIQGDEKEKDRLILCHLVEKVLKEGLSLLGLKTLDKL